MVKKRYINSISAVLKLFLLVLMLLSTTIIMVARATAQTTCDPEVMDTFESKGWLESQRTIIQNKNIISKPDSVLEYSCFNQFGSNLAATAETMFSDKHSTITHTPQMLNSLNALVGNSLVSYLSANFSHPYIDNRAQLGSGGGIITSAPITINANYNCAALQTVWKASQCLNFQNQGRDGFFSLDWYVTNDPRTVDGCSPSGGTGAYLSSAYNGNSAAYMVNNGSPIDGTKYAKDNVQSFLSLIQPGSCSQPIPTGLIVYRENYTYERYCDHVCSNPGCYYQPDSTLPGPFGGGPPCTSNAPGTTGQCIQ